MWNIFHINNTFIFFSILNNYSIQLQLTLTYNSNTWQNIAGLKKILKSLITIQNNWPDVFCSKGLVFEELIHGRIPLFQFLKLLKVFKFGPMQTVFMVKYSWLLKGNQVNGFSLYVSYNIRFNCCNKPTEIHVIICKWCCTVIKPVCTVYSQGLCRGYIVGMPVHFTTWTCSNTACM